MKRIHIRYLQCTVYIITNHIFTGEFTISLVKAAEFLVEILTPNSKNVYSTCNLHDLQMSHKVTGNGTI